MFTTADSEELSYDESCSDCKTELSRKRWVKLLLQWLHRCIRHDMQYKTLTHQWLVEVISKYKDDICDNELDKAILCTDDLEPFLTYKYPILRLRNLFEEKDQPRKLFIMASVLLYHCCINSLTGVVESDIIQQLTRQQRELILKFCETLSEMEITVNNVENAIRSACDEVNEPIKTRRRITPYPSIPTVESTATEGALNSDSSKCPSTRSTKQSNLTFRSSVTVLSSSASNIKASVPESDAEGDFGRVTADTSEQSMKNDRTRDRNVNDSGEGGSGKTIVVQRHEVSSFEDVPNGLASNELTDQCSCTACMNGLDCDSAECKNNCKRKRASSSNDKNPWIYRGMSVIRKTNRLFGLMKPKEAPPKKCRYKVFLAMILVFVVLITSSILAIFAVPSTEKAIPPALLLKEEFRPHRRAISTRQNENETHHLGWAWVCEDKLCRKVFQPKLDLDTYIASSRCILLCSGPQLWPYPIGLTYFSNQIIDISTEKLEYKFKTIQSENLHQYLSEAFKLFLGDLAKLERMRNFKPTNIEAKRMNIVIEVDTDLDPRMRLNTDESYHLKTKTDGDKFKIHITANSFCGVRHGFETLIQLILLDQSSGSLITLSEANIKDAPSYKYRGLMLDTARNFIPVPDILRTIDGMASVKLNTFHWRISDAASFPLFLPKIPELFEHGAYSRSMVYTKDDVMTIVRRAGVKGIRVLIEIAVPSPVGRAWSWSEHATCPKKNDNLTCDNVLCTRLKMEERLFGLLQQIYSEIIDMTGVDDIFHLSDNMFSLSHCYLLLDERDSFLEKALEQLRLANNGFMPTMPVIWFTPHLSKEHEAKIWERYGVQIYEWPTITDHSLSKFKVIHSSKWDLSCDITKQRCTRYRSWQEMYAWKSFPTIEAYSTEGGEAILWTDLVDSGNLDSHLWPRTAAVAERLWSDIVANRTAKGKVYLRLDNQRRRLLLKGIKVQPIWPAWCSYNPRPCFAKIKQSS